MRKLHFFTCDSWKLQKAIVSVGCLLFFFFICSCFYWEDGIRGQIRQIFLAFLKTFVRYFFLFLFVILNTSQIRVIVAQKYFSKSSPVLFSHINGGCEISCVRGDLRVVLVSPSLKTPISANIHSTLFKTVGCGPEERERDLSIEVPRELSEQKRPFGPSCRLESPPLYGDHATSGRDCYQDGEYC